VPIIHKFFQKTEEEGPLSSLFFEAIITLILKPYKDLKRKESLGLEAWLK
jgi:hypothetical protein